MMTSRELELFQNLMALTVDSEAFYFQDFDLDELKYRIFNYRLASYTDFLGVDALECRGIMYEIDAMGQPVRLASRPMQKFFNLNENPSTIGLDLSQVDTVELKADGSLISTYQHQYFLRLKSKGSLASEQAVDAHRYVTDVVPDLKYQLMQAEIAGYTVNMEWCAPHNRIVIGYLQPHLKVLNARHRETGQYMSREELEQRFGKFAIDRVDTKGLDIVSFVQSIPAMQDDIEGYVCRIGLLWFKSKTEKYMSLHHAKDSINNPRRLFEAIIDEGIDDLRSMFAHDELAIKTIDDMQSRVTTIYNHIVKMVEDYHAQNHALDRKHYAIGATGLEYKGLRLLGCAMNMYLGKNPDFKGFIKSKYKELGFKDVQAEQE